MRRLNYASILNAIKNYFKDQAKIIVRSYDQVSSSSENKFHDFCESLGIAWDDYYIIVENKLNMSISFDMAEALRTCKYGTLESSLEKKRVRSRLSVVLCKNHLDFKNTSIMSAEEKEALMEQYQEGNHIISEEYYGNKNLFSETLTEGTIWHPNRLRIFMYRFAFYVQKCH